MSEYKQIYEKEIILIMKQWFGGKIEFIGAYWDEETAKRVAANNLPTNGETFAISYNRVTLHGCMMDKIK